jgi:hypothetical protein
MSFSLMSSSLMSFSLMSSSLMSSSLMSFSLMSSSLISGYLIHFINHSPGEKYPEKRVTHIISLVTFDGMHYPFLFIHYFCSQNKCLGIPFVNMNVSEITDLV